MKTVSRTTALALVLAFSLSNAFANTPETIPASEPAAAAVSPPVAVPATPPSATPAAPKFGAGMQIPVDGTSLEAFDQSLADIKAKTTKPEYTTLTNAIDYLMVYYIDAKRDRAKLAAYLNGKTGEEIVGLVKWGK